MGFDLLNDAGEEFRFTNSGWSHVITFARLHDFNWPIDADREEKAALSPEEASALAEALERGLGDGDAAASADRVSEQLTRELVTPSSSPLFPNDPIRFEARAVEYWRQFIGYARRGGFTISF